MDLQVWHQNTLHNFVINYIYNTVKHVFKGQSPEFQTYNINTLSENINFICTSFRNRLFRCECKLILYLAIMYVNCVYPAISKSPKQLPNCLKIAETRVVLTVFIGVICSVSAYIVTVSLCCSTWIRNRKALLDPWLNNTEVYLTPFIVTENHTIAG
jgi:hypothetical protein